MFNVGNFLFSGLGQVGVAHQVKRSKFVYLPEESSDSMDYKEIPVNVAMSASQFGGEYAYCSSLAEESESAFMDVVSFFFPVYVMVKLHFCVH